MVLSEKSIITVLAKQLPVQDICGDGNHFAGL